jgi:hypothetical protein
MGQHGGDALSNLKKTHFFNRICLDCIQSINVRNFDLESLSLPFLLLSDRIQAGLQFLLLTLILGYTKITNL